jgi:hypothetical protein
MAAKDNDTLTVSDVAGELRLSRRSVQYLIRKGELAAFDVGKGSERPVLRRLSCFTMLR